MVIALRPNGHTHQVMQVAINTALWYKSNDPLVPLRWVLIRGPDGRIASMAFYAQIENWTLNILSTILFADELWRSPLKKYEGT